MKNFLLKTSITSTGFLVSLFVFAVVAHAGTQCCDLAAGEKECGRASANNCSGCSDSVESKNAGMCGPTCTDAQIKAGTCKICGPGQVSNACSTAATNSSLCKYTTNTPTKVTLKVNQQQVLSTNTFATGPLGGLRVFSSKPTIASISPSFTNLCCGMNYGYFPTPIKTTILAVAAGSTTVTTTFIAQDSKDTRVCSANVPVTVSGVAEPLVCKQGAKCTGSYVAGGSITCSMPTITDAAQITQYGTPRYYLKCNPFKGQVAQTPISKVSTTGTFPAFTVATGVTNLQCSFRYCQTTASGLIICSDWGQAS